MSKPSRILWNSCRWIIKNENENDKVKCSNNSFNEIFIFINQIINCNSVNIQEREKKMNRIFMVKNY